MKKVNYLTSTCGSAQLELKSHNAWLALWSCVIGKNHIFLKKVMASHLGKKSWHVASQERLTGTHRRNTSKSFSLNKNRAETLKGLLCSALSWIGLPLKATLVMFFPASKQKTDLFYTGNWNTVLRRIFMQTLNILRGYTSLPYRNFYRQFYNARFV